MYALMWFGKSFFELIIYYNNCVKLLHVAIRNVLHLIDEKVIWLMSDYVRKFIKFISKDRNVLRECTQSNEIYKNII